MHEKQGEASLNNLSFLVKSFKDLLSTISTSLKMADNGFSMHTVPSGSFTGNETSEQPIIQLMSSELLSTDAMIPFIQASNQNTKTSIEQQQKLSDENDRKYEAVKEMIKASEKYRTIERLAFNIVKRNSEGTAETLSVQSKKGKGYVDRMVGPEIVGDEPKMSCAFSLWVCCRIGKDLNLYWGTEQIGVHNSTFLVMLFGVQNRDGHSPYTTAIGKELEIQARDVVGRLLWSARCSSPEGIGYIGSVPRWLFSLVPMVRQFFVGSCNRIEGPSNNASNSISHESGSCGIVQHQTLSNGSARQSEPIMIDDYHDLAVQNAAWMRERDYFKDSVAKGCRAVEEKKTRDKSRKVSRIAQLDVSSPQSINLNLREAQEKITQGAEAMRKRVSKQLSPNRFTCRQQFCEAIGLMLNTFKKDGKEDAIKKGFAVEVPMLSAQEKDIFESRDIFNSSILTARTLEGGNESEVHETNLRELQDMAERFPCLVLKLKYPVTIVEDGSGSGNMEGNQEIPNKYI